MVSWPKIITWTEEKLMILFRRNGIASQLLPIHVMNLFTFSNVTIWWSIVSTYINKDTCWEGSRLFKAMASLAKWHLKLEENTLHWLQLLLKGPLVWVQIYKGSDAPKEQLV